MDHAPARPMPGGPLALDLANTIWHDDAGQRVDWLLDDAAVRRFCDEHGVVWTTAPVEHARDALTSARSIVHRILVSATADEPANDPSLSVAVDNALADTVVQSATIDGRLQLQITHPDPIQNLAISAVRGAIELVADQPTRTRCCDRDGCVLWFLDTSKGGRRRWCSMDRCGNRIKAQRHHQRSRTNG
ncbi:MAG: CGNR zinc finger domain-containing protein [Actinomycetota bacterium]